MGGNKLPTYNIEDNIDYNKENKQKKVQDEIPMAEGSELPFSSDAFKKHWLQWIDYRKELRKPSLTQTER